MPDYNEEIDSKVRNNSHTTVRRSNVEDQPERRIPCVFFLDQREAIVTWLFNSKCNTHSQALWIGRPSYNNVEITQQPLNTGYQTSSAGLGQMPCCSTYHDTQYTQACNLGFVFFLIQNGVQLLLAKNEIHMSGTLTSLIHKSCISSNIR